MKAATLVLSLVALLPEQESRFVTVELYAEIDSPIAAWQIELDCDAKIVGVEGLPEPPYYDPAALQGNRIILAQFTVQPSPPAGRVLVARVHLMETGRSDHSKYRATLMAAAAPGGERISPRIDVLRLVGK
jgi:hypothetical protein